MCLWTFTRYSCGHDSLNESYTFDAASCKKCVPVLVALEYYHDQPHFQPTEITWEARISTPSLCPPVLRPAGGITPKLDFWYRQADEFLWCHMHRIGITLKETRRVLQLAESFGLSSERPNIYFDRPFPPWKLNFLINLYEFQRRSFPAPNILFEEVPWGCGRPTGEADPALCLAGWTAGNILTMRMGDWNTGHINQGLVIDYGHPNHPPPERQYHGPIDSRIVIPLHASLERVLQDLEVEEALVDEKVSLHEEAPIDKKATADPAIQKKGPVIIYSEYPPAAASTEDQASKGKAKDDSSSQALQATQSEEYSPRPSARKIGPVIVDSNFPPSSPKSRQSNTVVASRRPALKLAIP